MEMRELLHKYFLNIYDKIGLVVKSSYGGVDTPPLDGPDSP